MNTAVWVLSAATLGCLAGGCLTGSPVAVQLGVAGLGVVALLDWYRWATGAEDPPPAAAERLLREVEDDTP